MRSEADGIDARLDALAASIERELEIDMRRDRAGRAEEAEGTVVAAVRLGGFVQRGLAGWDLEVVRHPVDRAERHEGDRARLGRREQRPCGLQGDRQDREPGAELPHAHMMA